MKSNLVVLDARVRDRFITMRKDGIAFPKGWHGPVLSVVSPDSKFTDEPASTAAVIKLVYTIFTSYLAMHSAQQLTVQLRKIKKLIKKILDFVTELENTIKSGFDAETIENALACALSVTDNLSHIETKDKITQRKRLLLAEKRIGISMNSMKRLVLTERSASALPAALTVALMEVEVLKKDVELFPERIEALFDSLEFKITWFSDQISVLKRSIDDRIGDIAIFRTPLGIYTALYKLDGNTKVFETGFVSLKTWQNSEFKDKLRNEVENKINSLKDEMQKTLEPFISSMRGPINHWKAILAGQSIAMILLDILNLNIALSKESEIILHQPSSLPIPSYEEVTKWNQMIGTGDTGAINFSPEKPNHEKVRYLVAISDYGTAQVDYAFNFIFGSPRRIKLHAGIRFSGYGYKGMDGEKLLFHLGYEKLLEYLVDTDEAHALILDTYKELGLSLRTSIPGGPGGIEIPIPRFQTINMLAYELSSLGYRKWRQYAMQRAKEEDLIDDVSSSSLDNDVATEEDLRTTSKPGFFN